LQDSFLRGEQPDENRNFSIGAQAARRFKIAPVGVGKNSSEQAWNRLNLSLSASNGHFSEWPRETKYNRNC
jgi:hypothetical protein